MNAQELARAVTAQNFLSLPDVVFRLNQLLDSPGVTNAAIGELLMTDPALSARVLKLANCPLFNVAGKVDTVSKAVSILGLNRIRSLVFTTFAAQSFEGIPEELVDMDRFWLNSVATGVIARALAFRCRIFDTELLFLAGLLLKLGRLAFYCSRPEQYRVVLRVKELGEAALIAEERAVFGFSYLELGAELMKVWQLPESLYRLVENHTAPLETLTFPREAAIVRIASELALLIDPGTNIPDDLDFDSLEIDQAATDALQLSSDLFSGLMFDAWVQSFEIMEIVRPDFARVY
ncbi:MAG: putative signal transduction protein [Proteobacteria bacterium]|nr:putative signal transduction protein [Pseudomonadota bacterium]